LGYVSSNHDADPGADVYECVDDRREQDADPEKVAGASSSANIGQGKGLTGPRAEEPYTKGALANSYSEESTFLIVEVNYFSHVHTMRMHIKL
jgi:hypothetical protein